MSNAEQRRLEEADTTGVPQRCWGPYGDLVATNGAHGKADPEYELLDTGIFGENRYFDVFVEYAKATPDDILLQITVHNRGPEEVAG